MRYITVQQQQQNNNNEILHPHIVGEYHKVLSRLLALIVPQNASELLSQSASDEQVPCTPFSWSQFFHKVRHGPLSQPEGDG